MNSLIFEDAIDTGKIPVLLVPERTTFFHVTHWKAGSQWMRGILEEAFGSALVSGDYIQEHGLEAKIELEKVYTGVYLARQEFETLEHNSNRRFILIRDLRDTLISGYFSIRYTHSLNRSIANWRRVLNHLSQEEGMLYLMEGWLRSNAFIQRSWLEAEERCLRLEDFMNDPVGQMEIAFCECWKMPVERNWVERLMANHRFEKYSGGRKPGHEDANSHYRKGVHGDWRLHFTPKISERFKKLYGDLLITAGYEQNDSWKA